MSASFITRGRVAQMKKDSPHYDYHFFADGGMLCSPSGVGIHQENEEDPIFTIRGWEITYAKKAGSRCGAKLREIAEKRG